MNRIKNLTLFILTFLALSCNTSRKAALKNQAPKNTPSSTPTLAQKYVSSMKGNYMLADSNSSKVNYWVEFQGIDDINLNKIDENFAIYWQQKTPDGIKEKLNSAKIDVFQNGKLLSDNKLLLTFDVPKVKGYPQSNLNLEIIDKNGSKKFTNFLEIDFGGQRIDSRYAIFLEGNETPINKHFLYADEKFIIASIQKNDKKLYLKKIDADFGPALSPMSSSKKNILEKITNITSKEIETNKINQIHEPGLYVLTEDSLFYENGFSFRVVDENFPRLTKVYDLPVPLVYMSTQEEIKSFDSLSNKKEALDNYFLNLTNGNETRAKDIIKYYYRRVAQANEMFTNYQEGWQTDKGMVYTIMGSPAQVRKSGDKEVWIYNQSGNKSEIVYTFYKRPNVFTDENYELIRYPEYSTYWFPNVERWRDGLNK